MCVFVLFIYRCEPAAIIRVPVPLPETGRSVG